MPKYGRNVSIVEKQKKEYEDAKKINKSGIKNFELQEKAKSLIAKNKVTYNVTELQLLLCWKLGDKYHQHNKKKSVELQALGCSIKAIQILLTSCSLKKSKSPQYLPSTRSNLAVSGSATSKAALITWLDTLLHSSSSFKSNWMQ